jgi:hypothetical protein
MIRLAYPLAAQRKSARSLMLRAAACAGLVAALGCQAGVKSTPAGTGGGGGSGLLGTAGTTGTAGGSGGSVPGFGGFGGGNTPDGGCMQRDYTFEPKIPTVYLLVDRSGSMFHCLTGDTGSAVCAQPANTAWSNLKEAVRSVVGTLDAEVRFGFATIWGTDPTQGGMCPSTMNPPMTTDNVAPALNNAAAIMTKYDSLAFPPNSTQQGVKFESPTSESIAVVSGVLRNDTTPGDKFIIFITDGQPDYCDDSNGLCAPDSVVAQLQAAKTAGVSTVVLGLQTSLFDLGTGILQAYANAGAGEATVAPLRAGLDTFAFYDQCNGVTGWHNDLVALAKPNARGTTLGTYSATAGMTRPYMPSAADQTMLVTQLSAALSGVKSCVFDLSDPTTGQVIRVNRNKLDKASVAIEGTKVLLDPTNTNGWNMISDTQLQLFGKACDDWRNPNAKNIAFDFPCETLNPDG